MGDFGKFGTFQKPSTIGEAREEPTVLLPTKEIIPEARVEKAATEKITKPTRAGKPINTYEERVKGRYEVGGIAIGSLIDMTYQRFQHDPQPRVFVLRYSPEYNMISGFNLHYMSPKAQMDFILKVLYINNAAIVKGLPFNTQYQAYKRLVTQVANYIPYRNYKMFAIKNPKEIHVNKWVNESKRTRTILPG